MDHGPDRKMFALLLLLVLLTGASPETDADDGYSNDAPYEIKPKSVRLPANSTYTLNCNYNDQPQGTGKSGRISWERKRCKTISKCDTSNIALSQGDEWEPCSSEKKAKIEINKAEGRLHNGLYRCLEYGKVRKAYIVEVVERLKYSGPKPEVVSIRTSNTTTNSNISFIIQCNVTSVSIPTIRWMKKCYSSNCVEYDGMCYCHVNFTRSGSPPGSNTYLSKISIPNATEADNGVYVCLALTSYGKDHKNVTITVPKGGTKESFSLLFLIPFGLLLAPVIVWLCYYRGKRKVKKPVVTKVEQQQRKNLI